MRTSWIAGVATVLMASAAGAHAQTAAQPAVDLKLFEKAEADRSKGCTVTLWQANRDPQTDRFAIIFNEQLTGKDNNRQPGKMKIGSDTVSLTRVAVGGKTPGFGLYPYQLYKMAGEDNFVVMELKLGEEMGEAVEIDSGTLNIIMKGSQVFRASVKGGAGCMGAPLPDAPRAGSAATVPAKPATAVVSSPRQDPGPVMFQRYQVRPEQVPAVMTRAAQKFGCEAATLKGIVTGFQMSEESAIWQIPCGDYGTQKSAVFALVYLADPAKQHTFLPFRFPKGQNRGLGEYPIMAPKWDMKTRTVSSINTEGNGKDCGTLERHAVTEDGQFRLIELRSREMCDGKDVGVENFPMIFKAR
jgi:hypothetical protein